MENRWEDELIRQIRTASEKVSSATLLSFRLRHYIPLGPHGLDLKFKELHFQRSGVDMLLWSTNATGAEVVAASEKRFSLTATLKLQLPRAHTAVASLVMARDSWKEPFSWRISAGEKSSNDEVWMEGGVLGSGPRGEDLHESW